MCRFPIVAAIAFTPVALAIDIVSPEGTGTELLARNWGSASRLIFYDGPNFSGRFVINNCSDLCNYNQPGMNFRASSLRVENGNWILCSRANLQGECRTFGPGDYPHISPGLPPELDKQIISIRRISD